MVVVAVIGIMTAIAVPAFSGYLKRTRLNGARNQLISDVYYARSLAIAKRRTFAIQFQPDTYSIVDTSDGSVVRTVTAPSGIDFGTDVDPNFYAWGLADAANFTLTDSYGTQTVTVLPTGSVDHGY
jgi:Tfp pilus assembly protein FimT